MKSLAELLVLTVIVCVGIAVLADDLLLGLLGAAMFLGPVLVLVALGWLLGDQHHL